MSAETRPQPDEPLIRIGELSRRTGVPVDSLRAWERRYGLVNPVRSAGRYRLYSPADVERVKAMRSLLEEGIAAAEAAALARRGRPTAEPTAAPRPAGDLERLADELFEALAKLDERAAHSVLDRALASFSLEAFATEVVLPVLREIGNRWEIGELDIDQEHFATHVIRGRLLGLGRGWTGGPGPLALLACARGEQHDLGLIVFGLILRARGWRIALLGADIPAEAVAASAERLAPDLVVVSAVSPDRFSEEASALRELAERWPLVLGGAGATDALASAAGGVSLGGGPVEAAQVVAETAAGVPWDRPAPGGERR